MGFLFHFCGGSFGYFPLFFCLHKLRYHFWVLPNPKYSTQTSSTHHLSRREIQSLVHCPTQADSTWRTSKDWQENPIRSFPCCYSQTLHFARIFTDPILHHCQITSATWVAWDFKKKRHFATNHFSQSTPAIFMMGAQTWRCWTSRITASQVIGNREISNEISELYPNWVSPLGHWWLLVRDLWHVATWRGW